MYAIVDILNNKIVQRNILSLSNLVWPDGQISDDETNIGEVREIVSNQDEGGPEVINRWQIYEDSEESIIPTIIKELSLRGEAASTEFRELVRSLKFK